MKKRYWEGNNGRPRKTIRRWASMRSGYPHDGGAIVFRWGEAESVSQKVVISEEVAVVLALSWVKNVQEIEQEQDTE